MKRVGCTLSRTNVISNMVLANMAVMGLYWPSNYRNTGPTLLSITGPVQFFTETVNWAGTSILYWNGSGPVLGQYRHAVLAQYWQYTGMVVVQYWHSALAQYWVSTGMLYWPRTGTTLEWWWFNTGIGHWHSTGPLQHAVTDWNISGPVLGLHSSRGSNKHQDRCDVQCTQLYF